MKLVAEYTYKKENGATVGKVLRFQSEDSVKPSKSFVPYFNIDDKGELQKGLPDAIKGSIPLYGIESVKNKTQPVYIVEGEKCAFALHGLGIQAVTSQGGSKATHLTDWSFLSSCSNIRIVPDNDESGNKYAESSYKKIRSLGNLASIQIVRLPHLKQGDDICDVISNSFPSLGWDELSSLNDVDSAEEVKNKLVTLLESNLESIPPEWNMVFTKKRLPAIAIGDFQKMPIPERKAYLAPWLTAQSINMVFAPRGLGKTFFSLSCALAVAEGKEVMGYLASQVAPVLYLDGEMQSPLLQERFELLRNNSKEPIPFHLVTPDLLCDRVMPDLSSPEGQKDIDELIEKLGIKVLFIDNLSTLARTGKENESESWLPIQQWLIQLRSKGLAIVLVHHANKTGAQRGTSRKEDIMDNIISLKRPDDYEEDQGARFTVEYTKARSLSGDDSKAFEAQLVLKDEVSQWIVNKVGSKKERAIEMKSMGMNARDISNTLEVDVSTVHRYLKGHSFKKKPSTPFTKMASK